MSTLADLQSEVAALKAEVARLREETSLFFTIHRDDDGQVTDTQLHCWMLHCEMIDLRAREARESAGGIGVDEDGAYISLWGTDRELRASMRVTGDSGEFELVGPDRHPVVRLWEQEGHGHVGVLSRGNVPRAVMKGMANGGTVTAVDADGKPAAVLNSLHGRGAVVVLENQHLRAEMTSNEAGGLISTTSAAAEKSCVIGSSPAGSTLLLSKPDGSDGVSIAATVAGNIVALGSPGDGAGEGPVVSLSDLPGLGGSIVIRDRAGAEAVDLSTDESGGSIRVAGPEKAQVLLQINQEAGRVAVSHRNGTALAALHAQENGGIVGAHGANKSATLLSASPEGGSFSVVHGDHIQLVAGTAEDGSALVALNAPDNTTVARLACGPQGGGVVLSGKDGTVQAGLAAGEAGGSATVFSELGVERATLRSADDGGGLHLKWGGTTGLVAAATERGGIVTAHGPDGQVVETLPELEKFGEEDEPLE